jgi:hypothetical protein
MKKCETAFGGLAKKKMAGSLREPAIPTYLQKGEEKVS